MAKSFLALLLAVGMAFLQTSPVFAQPASPMPTLPPVVAPSTNQNFATSLSSTYRVNEQGTTRVEHTFTITNRTPTLYVSQYGLKLSSTTEIRNVSVTSNRQPLPANVVSAGGVASIGITFPDHLVGQGKKRIFTIGYETDDLAQVSGQVLEVRIPKLASDESYDDYNVSLATPKKFGPPTKITPSNFTSSPEDVDTFIKFENLENQAITAFYGQSQIFNLSLRYHLVNPSTTDAITQIALPPDTTYQHVYYEAIEPPPNHVELDADGNWIATYKLPPKAEIEVNAIAKTQLTLEPHTRFFTLSPSSSYLSGQEYWETGNSQIRSLAKTHTTPLDIHRYVVGALQYQTPDLSQPVERLGAAGALNNPNQATCQEFTDLFVALARANNIPSRRLTGYAHTQNTELRPVSLVDDILHAWPDYYDAVQQRWAQIDPTWENTTRGVNYFDQFDLNHIVFAINGSSSTTPFPAGSYKKMNTTTKDVEVTFGDTFAPAVPSFHLAIQPKKILGFNIPGKYVLTVQNKTGYAWYNPELQLVTPPSHVFYLDNPKRSALLPFQNWEIPLAVYTREWGNSQTQTIPFSLKIDHHHEPYAFEPISLTVAARSWYYITQPIGLVGLGISGVILTLVTGSLLVPRRRRPGPVRW